MRDFRTIAVCPVRSLEAGDLIAMEFLGGITSGKVTALVLCPYQLTESQREYLTETENIDIPENEYEPIGGSASYLIFGEFTRTGRDSRDTIKHMFVSFDTNVAVFPTDKKE